MVISIIIPTYNRSHLIELTLESFIKQNFRKEDFEIIISNNNSTDNTEKVVRNFIEKNSSFNIRYILESRQGVHFARNTAAKLAKGEFLYFTDDDMIADPDALKELLYLFSLDEKVASVTGLVLPQWEITPPDWILKLCNNALLSLNDPDYDLIISEKDCNVFSCHQMIRRNVFFLSGGFNPENTKGVWIGDGETGLNIKIKEEGFKFAFNRRSVINHIIPAFRLTQKYLNIRMANQGNCDIYTWYRKSNPSSLILLKAIFICLMKIIYSSLKCIFNYLMGNILWRMNQASCFYNIAGIKYLAKLLTDSSWRALVLKSNWLEE